MLKKTITYQDMDGNDITEDFYFNLNKAEITEMELSHEGGYSEYLKRVIESKDGGEIIGAFKEIIKASVGRRSEDGKRFIKSEEITNEFLQTDAYSVLFMDLVTNADAAAEFVRGISPADMAAQMTGEEAKDETPAYILEGREPTTKELQEMSEGELREVFRRKSSGSSESQE